MSDMREQEATGDHRFLDLREAARLVGLDWRTVRARVLAGELPAFRFGRKWRISEAALNAFMVDRSPAVAKKDQP